MRAEASAVLQLQPRSKQQHHERDHLTSSQCSSCHVHLECGAQAWKLTVGASKTHKSDSSASF